MDVKIGGACAVVLAAALLAAPCASARRPRTTLELRAGGQALAAGAPLQASATTFKLYTESWSLECSQALLTGELSLNGSTTDAAAIADGEFGGDTRNEAGCSSTYEFVAYWEPQAPVELQLSKSGAAKLSNPRWRLVPLEDVGLKGHEPVSCVIDRLRKPLPGTFKVSGNPRPLTVTFAYNMHLGADHGPDCGNPPHEVVDIDAVFNFTSEGVPVEVLRTH